MKGDTAAERKQSQRKAREKLFPLSRAPFLRIKRALPRQSERGEGASERERGVGRAGGSEEEAGGRARAKKDQGRRGGERAQAAQRQSQPKQQLIEGFR